MKLWPVAIAFLLLLVAAPLSAQTGSERAVGSRLAQDYAALRDRPLFSPDRQPPARIAAAPAATPEPQPEPEPELPEATPEQAPQWQLIGVVRSERLRSALFRVSYDNSVFSLRRGESRDGWTLTSVEPFEAVLDSGHARAFMRFPESQ
ncbi:MAG: hypothetical protein KL840_24135 [Aquamicrobium sp.]|nr:hypothetical protein [Aquamicrobium sp.]